MSKYSRSIVGLTAIVVLMSASALNAGLDDHPLIWHTYMGSDTEDFGHAIAADSSGNVYVTGWSDATWGSPLDPHSGGRDAFVAKLSSQGERVWHLFLGSSGWDEARSVAVDGFGNVYVTGTSDASWGTPVHSHSGQLDGFAVKLNSDGELQWNTFMGQNVTDEEGRDIAVDGSGAVYIGGLGGTAWDTVPVDPPLGSADVWVTKLSASGARQWYTFMGSADLDFVRSIAVDNNSNVYAAGRSFAAWGSPVNAFAGGASDTAVWKLNGSGARQWHTYMGSAGEDYGFGIAVDESGNAYVSGVSPMSWGTPINPFVAGAGETEGFAAKLKPNGTREWNTFVGRDVGGWGMAVSDSRHVFVGGLPQAVELSPRGIFQRNFTMPAGGSGEGGCVAVGATRIVYFVGAIDYDWGTPVSPFAGTTGTWNAYVVKFDGPWVDYFIGEPDLQTDCCPR